MDPGLVLLGLLGSPNIADRRWVTEQYDSTVQTNTVAGPARGGSAVLRVKGTPLGLVASTDCVQGVAALDPVPRRGDERRRGHAQRLHHRRPAAGRHQLPQLRRSNPSGGVLAALRGGSRPRRRVPRARAPRDGRERLALQRVARWRDRADAPDRRGRTAGRCLTGGRPGLRGPDDAVLLVGEIDAGPRRLRVPAAGRRTRRPGRRAARVGSRAGGSAPAVRPRGHRARSRRVRPGRERGRPRGGPCRVRDLGRPGRTPATARRWVAGRRTVRREPLEDRPDRAAPPCRRTGVCSRASTVCRWKTLGAVGGDRLVIELAGDGATGAAEGRGARVADAVDVALDDLRHAWRHGLPRALGLAPVEGIA